MNKVELSEQIEKDSGITEKQANEAVEASTGAVVSTVCPYITLIAPGDLSSHNHYY